MKHRASYDSELRKGGSDVLLDSLQLILRLTYQIDRGTIGLGACHDADHALKLLERPNPTTGGDLHLPRGTAAVGNYLSAHIKQILPGNSGACDAPQQHPVGEDQRTQLRASSSPGIRQVIRCLFHQGNAKKSSLGARHHVFSSAL
jgi:hypothetical protein